MMASQAFLVDHTLKKKKQNTDLLMTDTAIYQGTHNKQSFFPRPRSVSPGPPPSLSPRVHVAVDEHVRTWRFPLFVFPSSV